MSKTENSAPNIVLIVTDQQRWDTLGCLGYDHVITPHIDRNEAWKLVFYPGEPYGELYHLEEDPDELYNLYDDPAHAGARGEMVERMMDWYGKTRMQR